MTWTEGSMPATGVIGGQPLVQPSGTVIMPIANSTVTSLLSFKSIDGGVHWSSPITVTAITAKMNPGGIRSDAFPSAEIDQNGRILVVWSDCRFRTNCSTNDIVMTTTTDGLSWTPVFRVPIDPVTSTVDHFIPGIAVDKQTSGNTAHIELAFYFYPNVTCTASTCQLDVGSVTSTNGGGTWSAMTQLAGPMTLSWLPNTSQGRMVGDYISSSFSRGTAHPVFAVAQSPFSGGNDCAVATPHCNQSMFSPAAGLAASAGVPARSAPTPPVASNSHRATRPTTAR